MGGTLIWDGGGRYGCMGIILGRRGVSGGEWSIVLGGGGWESNFGEWRGGGGVNLLMMPLF